MYKLSNTLVDPVHLAQLREWFISEWAEVDPFEVSHEGLQVPSPIVITENDRLLGGLSFTWAQKPNVAEMAIWINAVLVSPEYRGMGLASQLIQAAESEAKNSGVNELFVYSEFPRLYQKLGWQVREGEGASKVLWKSLEIVQGDA